MNSSLADTVALTYSLVPRPFPMYFVNVHASINEIRRKGSSGDETIDYTYLLSLSLCVHVSSP